MKTNEKKKMLKYEIEIKRMRRMVVSGSHVKSGLAEIYVLYIGLLFKK